MEPTEGGQGRCVKIIEWLFDDEVFQGKFPLCAVIKPCKKESFSLLYPRYSSYEMKSPSITETIE